MSGPTIANGATVSARYSATLLRAASGSTEKNSEPANDSVTSVSPTTLAAWVRASRMNGVTTKASAPVADRRRLGAGPANSVTPHTLGVTTVSDVARSRAIHVP